MIAGDHILTRCGGRDGFAGTPRRRPDHLRGGLPVRARAPRLRPGGPVRAGGRARGAGGRRGIAPRVRARPARTWSRRSPTTGTARSCARSGARTTSSGSTAPRSRSPRRSPPSRAPCSPGTSRNTHLFEPDDPATHVARPGDVRGAGRMGGRGRRRLRDRRDLPVLRGGAARGARGHCRPGLACVATLAIFKEPGDLRRRAGGRGVQAARRRRARTSSGSTACAARRRCCRCWGRSSPPSTCRSPRCPCPTARPRRRRPSSRSATPGYPSPPGGRAFPTALDPLLCNRYEIADFTASAAALGVRYLGLCCGAGPHHIRAMAEALGRTPPASRYSPDMAGHALFGDGDGAASARTRHEQRL